MTISQIASQNAKNSGLVIENSNTFLNSNKFDGKNVNFFTYFRKSFIFYFLQVDLCKDERLKLFEKKISQILVKFVKIELSELCTAECSGSQITQKNQAFGRGKRQTEINKSIIKDGTFTDSTFFSSKSKFFNCSFS